MTKGIVALGAFLGAVAISICVFATMGHALLISTITSPDNTYVVNLSGRKSRPVLPIIEHAVYVDLFRHGQPIMRGRKLHSGDWFDPAFENLYPEYSWENISTLKFHRGKEPEQSWDTLNVTNNTSKTIKFLRVQARELFLLFDLRAQAHTKLSAFPQTWLAGIMVEGEFEDGKPIPRTLVEFLIERDMKGPFTYEVAINEGGPTVTSPQLLEYRPE